MFSTICTCTHEWSDIPSRSAFTCCTCHQRLELVVGVGGVEQRLELAVAAGGRADAQRCHGFAGVAGSGGAARDSIGSVPLSRRSVPA